jgi:CheY-like chemotaxis protein
MTPVAVNEVIGNMRTLLHHAIGRSIAVETALDPAAGHGVCDANQLENAVLNLAINARDAMPEGGTLTIATARLSLDAAPDLGAGDYVEVRVADTGEGMRPEVLARAIEPFYSTKPLGKGTGLGLAQVYGIVQQSGGAMRIESEPGRGTMVRLFLPAAPPPAAEAEGQAQPGTAADAPARRARVLVIDDDADVRDFLVDTLQSLGHEVAAAASGEEGLARLSEWPADLALIDYAMPGMSGADAARAARKARPDLPIVFVTGYAESEKLEDALGSQVAVLRKPFSIAQLEAAVERNLAN